MSMRVIAIDPGYDRVGVAILKRSPKQEGTREELLHSTCITSNRQDSYYNRLHEVGKKLEDLIKKYSPDIMVLEKVYFNTNQKTAMAVSEARGMMIYIASINKIEVCEYTPPQVKSAVTGDGHASKHQVSVMINKLIKIREKPTHDDEYDAIAIGLTCLASLKGTK
jgi:crossover junction endodeoxyribonuclease RuvC